MPYPFLLMTFLLADIAAILALFIMMSQHRNGFKNSKKLALNLKIEKEILTLHQSIKVLIEQRLQQVLENQITAIKLLNELHLKSDKSGQVMKSGSTQSPAVV
jgi:uncharacterized membrane protein